MKKKYIAVIIIVLIILIALGGYFLYNKRIEDGRKYEIEQINELNYFVVKTSNGYGVINKDGEIVVEAKYDNVIIPNPQKALFICYSDEESVVLNERNEIILGEFQNVEPIRLKNIASNLMYEKSVLTYKQDGKMGLIDFNGKKITKPVYNEISGLTYKEGELLVKQNEKFGVINIKGNILVPIEYDEISIDGYSSKNNNSEKSGYVVSRKTDNGFRYGYVNSKGKEEISTEYNDLSRITDIESNDIYIEAAKNGQYGILKNGELIINNEYQSIRYEKGNNIFIIEKNKKFGVANIEGKITIPIEYTQIDITGMYIYARNNEETTVYDINCNMANIDSNIAIIQTENEKYRIKIDNANGTQYNLIDENNNQLTKQKYSYIEYLYDDYFIASIESGKLGVINSKEEQIIEIKYDSIEKIQDTQLLKTTITQDKTTQIYNKDLKQVINIANANIETNKDYIKIYDESQTKYLDKTGNEIENTKLLKDNKIFAKSNNGKWGFLDSNGNKIVDYIYDKVTDFNEYGFAAVKKNGKWGAIDSEGKVVVEPIYEFDSSKEPSFIGEFYEVQFGFGEVYYSNSK